MKPKKKIKYGTAELDPDEFSPLYARAQISIKIPLDTLDRFRAEAEKRGTKYQTLMNDVLQDAAIRFAGKGIDPTIEVIRWMEKGQELVRGLKKKVSSG